MMKLQISLGKIHLLRGQQPQPPSHKCLTGTVEGEGKAFSHIRPVRLGGQDGEEKSRMTHEIKS